MCTAYCTCIINGVVCAQDIKVLAYMHTDRYSTYMCIQKAAVRALSLCSMYVCRYVHTDGPPPGGPPPLLQYR